MRTFDRKFGDDFLPGVPAEPGVYRFYGPEDALLYVGKARNLRRRLAQYRTTGRRKKERKRRAVYLRAVPRLRDPEQCRDGSPTMQRAARSSQHPPVKLGIGEFGCRARGERCDNRSHTRGGKAGWRGPPERTDGADHHLDLRSGVDPPTCL